MLVDDGKIVKIFDEPEKDGDPFEVSDADTMIKHINPNWTETPSAFIITKPNCPYCTTAKETLKAKGFHFEEMVLGRDFSIKSVQAMTGKDTVPQVFIGGKHIGGNDELQAYVS